ncbi:murein hydrolase activator EnvC family protein [Jiella marina]|uniref:murein hydrolase activator EnvC family protein n=1 Tax=Jiella sp. LLJ827 TaxID=2917712 RepID=UPI00210191D4|nr:peptidoglycan DD-metalloendopeptidase family protein [Jiella sp. LLJ827]MCQ0987789.1 peptidoglycan DD-metalloendopeptidase family protein [Jiella sp. LLJ827]
MAVGAIAPLSSKSLEKEREKTSQELADLASRIELSQETIRDLEQEIAAIAADRNELDEALRQSTAEQRKISDELASTEDRIAGLAREESGIKDSLVERRDLLAEVLAALERMGRKPPPALLVRPRDALGAVRSAILLGAVVPKIREETERLVADLERLSTVRETILAEKERFAEQLMRHRREEARLARLFDEKQRLQAERSERRQAEIARAADLAKQADDLQELIDTLQADADAAREREEAARREAERRAAEAREAAAKRLAEQAAARERLALRRLEEGESRTATGRSGRVTPDAAPGTEDGEATPQDDGDTRIAEVPEEAPDATVPSAPDAAPAVAESEPQGGAPAADEETVEMASLEPDNSPEPSYDIAALRNKTALLAPAAPFSTLKGRLSKPVLGRQIIGFGETDDIGRVTTGSSFATRAGDVVVAPADGRVLYAGAFRSYGQLLILDAGDGYHVVLAGMERIDVESGQFVSAGEPVALMGARRLASVQMAEFGASEPALYVEFRKDGKPVDPQPWWMAEPSGRTRNDS